MYVSYMHVSMYVCMYVCMYGQHFQYRMDQPGKLANPVRGQLNTIFVSHPILSIILS